MKLPSQFLSPLSSFIRLEGCQTFILSALLKKLSPYLVPYFSLSLSSLLPIVLCLSFSCVAWQTAHHILPCPLLVAAFVEKRFHPVES
jgi:hypothetical protein